VVAVWGAGLKLFSPLCLCVHQEFAALCVSGGGGGLMAVASCFISRASRLLAALTGSFEITLHGASSLLVLVQSAHPM
jgi:hypothetical protein